MELTQIDVIPAYTLQEGDIVFHGGTFKEIFWRGDVYNNIVVHLDSGEEWDIDNPFLPVPIYGYV